jgi:hypothetical protein
MFKLTFTFALDSNFQQTLSREKSLEYINSVYGTSVLAYTLAGGYTLTENQGGYIMNNGSLVVEPSYSLSVMTEESVPDTYVKSFVDSIKNLEKQEAVMVEEQLVSVSFM